MAVRRRRRISSNSSWIREKVSVKAVTIAILGILASASVLHADEYDLVVYGSSPAAISAAVQAKRMGLRAVIVSPEKRMDVLSIPMRIEAPAASTIADIYFP